MRGFIKAMLMLFLVFLVLSSFTALFNLQGGLFVKELILAIVFLLASVIAIGAMARPGRGAFLFTTVLLALFLFNFIYLYFIMDSTLMLGILVVNVVGFIFSLQGMLESRPKPKVHAVAEFKEEKVAAPARKKARATRKKARRRT
ncbi:MAG: hypothetical protein KJ709_02325 [Nanoarchaeota archaeon]|nr:hypothetical protein [Nanoarchaeota archaeon]